MANFIFNVAKGQDVAFANNVINNTPATSVFVIVLLQASQADDDLNNYDNLSLLLDNPANTEADFTNYSRLLIDDGELTVTINDTTNKVTIDFPDKVWASAGLTVDNTLTKMLVCYDNDTLSGNDTNIVPVYAYDYAATTNGENLEARPAAAGLSEQ